jgi:hypothetical protein
VKRTNKIIWSLIIVLVMISCNENGNGPTNPAAQELASGYYPGGLGSTFNFRYDTLNNASNVFESVGTRFSEFTDYAVSGTSENIVQENTQTINGINTNSTLKLRRTNAGVYFLIDSLDLLPLLETLPDSLKDRIEFQVDNEIIALSTPLQPTKNWSAFKAVVTLKDFGISLTLVELKVYYEGEEELFIEAVSENRMSKKIRYEFRLSIPDITTTDLTALLNPPTTTFSTECWFVEDVGLVKLEGNSFLINSLNSGSLTMSDTSGTAREVLTSYNLN